MTVKRMLSLCLQEYERERETWRCLLLLSTQNTKERKKQVCDVVFYI
jgi:hypothetical protein